MDKRVEEDGEGGGRAGGMMVVGLGSQRAEKDKEEPEVEESE